MRKKYVAGVAVQLAEQDGARHQIALARYQIQARRKPLLAFSFHTFTSLGAVVKHVRAVDKEATAWHGYYQVTGEGYYFEHEYHSKGGSVQAGGDLEEYDPEAVYSKASTWTRLARDVQDLRFLFRSWPEEQLESSNPGLSNQVRTSKLDTQSGPGVVRKWVRSVPEHTLEIASGAAMALSALRQAHGRRDDEDISVDPLYAYDEDEAGEFVAAEMRWNAQI